MTRRLWPILMLLGCEPEPAEVCGPADQTLDVARATRGMFFVERRPAGGSCPTVNVPAPLEVGYLFDVEATDCPPARPGACATVLPKTVALESTLGPVPAVPSLLDRYCVYRTREPNDAPILADVSPGARFGPARAVVASAATTGSLTDDAAVAFSARANNNLCLAPVTSTTGVDLVLLDTRVSGEGEPDLTTGGHGEDLAAIVTSLACQDVTDCDVAVRTRLALPLVATNDPTSAHAWQFDGSGAYGSLDWLAQAIFREVLRWQNDQAAGLDRRLVLNLSLAWHGAWGGGQVTTATDSPDIMAVYDALRYARCSGALVVAATGNRTGCDLDDAPMYPAAWEAVDLAPGDCKDFGIAAPRLGDDRGEEPRDVLPLVYAAGALGDEQRQLGIGRIDDQSVLSAYGQAVPVPGTDRTLTGSSVGAAIVAVDAARRWSAAPTLTADGVMNDVLAGAEPTPHPTSGPFATSSWSSALVTHQVGACVQPTTEAPGVDICGNTPCPQSANGGMPNAAYAFLDMLPAENYQPFANPTPTSSPCPLCGYDGSKNDLVLTLSTKLPAAVVTDAVLAVQFSAGWVSFPLPAVTPGQTTRVRLTNPPNQAAKRASVLFNIDKQGFVADVPVLDPGP